MTSHRKTSRRQFLAGRSAVLAIDDALPAEEVSPLPAAEQGTVSGETYLLEIGRPAMACQFDVFLNAGQHPGGTEIAVEALDLIDDLETQMTVYRSTSEVIEINRRAAQAPVTVEAGLFQLLMRALEIHRETTGAFDITSSPLSRAWGFFRRAGRFPRPEEIAAALSQVGSHWLQFDEATRQIRFNHPSLEINLNAIGKGYALDRAAALMEQRDLKDFLIHGGQSSIVARGSRTIGNSGTAGWVVALRNPLRLDRQLAEIVLMDRALGTSGAGNQFFHFQGRRYGHIIDPRTGYPADKVLSATVLAPDAATADALATAFFVSGVDESLTYCSTHPQIAAILVVAGRRAGEVEVVSTGLDESELRLIRNDS
jgi:thiamine biosynthesis lipoprotein